MKQRALVAYESMWGNTALIARAVAGGLGESVETTIVDIASTPPTPGPEVTLVVAGGPTHAFSMTRANTRADAIRRGAPARASDPGLREWLSGLPQRPDAQQLVTFDTQTAMARHLPGSAAKSAGRVARRHGYPKFAPSETFYVNDVTGPLLDGETARANQWGRQLGLQLLGTG